MRQKPKEEKEKQGTYEPSKEGLEPVEYETYERIPTAPPDWPVEAQKIWMDRCQDLKISGYLVKAMMAPLRRYCFAVYQAEHAEKMLIYGGFTTLEKGTMGQEYEVVSKWVNVLDNANKVIDRFGAKFGFTPLDVHKIPAIQKKQGSEMSLLK
jgi:phage terminase small subunit